MLKEGMKDSRRELTLFREGILILGIGSFLFPFTLTFGYGSGLRKKWI